MHPGADPTDHTTPDAAAPPRCRAAALPTIIDRIRQGYTFVTVQSLTG